MPRKKYKAGQLITITTPIRRVLRVKCATDPFLGLCNKCHIRSLQKNYTLEGNYDIAYKLHCKICIDLCQKIPARDYFVICPTNFDWELDKL